MLALALIESILPGLAVMLITGAFISHTHIDQHPPPPQPDHFLHPASLPPPGLVWWQARRKRLALTEECLVRIKVTINRH